MEHAKFEIGKGKETINGVKEGLRHMQRKIFVLEEESDQRDKG